MISLSVFFGIVTGSHPRLSGTLFYVISEECFDSKFTSDHARTVRELQSQNSLFMTD